MSYSNFWHENPGVGIEVGLVEEVRNSPLHTHFAYEPENIHSIRSFNSSQEGRTLKTIYDN